MAEETSKTPPAPAGGAATAPAKSGKLPYIILAAVVPVCAGMGFGLGRLLAQPKPVDAHAVEPEPAGVEQMLDKSGKGKENWFYQVEAVLVNLNDPGATRYARMGFTLEITGELPEEKGKTLLDGKKDVVTNWLTLYLSSKGLRDIQGQQNMQRVLAEVKQGLNAKLFSQTKPLILDVLYREMAIQ